MPVITLLKPGSLIFPENPATVPICLLYTSERKANASAGNIRINCSSYDKTRKTFVYLGNLELIAMEVYELKVPKTKHSMDVPVFYLVA